MKSAGPEEDPVMNFFLNGREFANSLRQSLLLPTLKVGHDVTKSVNSYGKAVYQYTNHHLTFSMMQTRLIPLPTSTWCSPLPRMNASGTTICRSTKWDIIPVPVDICR